MGGTHVFAKLRRCRILMAANILLLIVMFLLPKYSAEGYSVLKNTTSHLGAQSSPHAWVMNAVFCLLGAACILEGWLHLKSLWFQKVVLTVFGLGLITTALFQHAPIIEGLPANLLEDQLHSISATVVGFSFTVLAFSMSFVPAAPRYRFLAVLAGCMSVAFSLLMLNFSGLVGLFQRLMFILAFAWLIFLLEKLRAGDLTG